MIDFYNIDVQKEYANMCSREDEFDRLDIATLSFYVDLNQFVLDHYEELSMGGSPNFVSFMFRTNKLISAIEKK